MINIHYVIRKILNFLTLTNLMENPIQINDLFVNEKGYVYCVKPIDKGIINVYYVLEIVDSLGKPYNIDDSDWDIYVVSLDELNKIFKPYEGERKFHYKRLNDDFGFYNNDVVEFGEISYKTIFPTLEDFLEIKDYTLIKRFGCIISYTFELNSDGSVSIIVYRINKNGFVQGFEHEYNPETDEAIVKELLEKAKNLLW